MKKFIISLFFTLSIGFLSAQLPANFELVTLEEDIVIVERNHVGILRNELVVSDGNTGHQIIKLKNNSQVNLSNNLQTTVQVLNLVEDQGYSLEHTIGMINESQEIQYLFIRKELVNIKEK